MQRSSRAAAAAVALLASACVSDTPTEATPAATAPTFSISDGAHGGVVGGVYWLTPTVKRSQKEFTGTFDPALAPVIDICRIESDAPAGPAACVGPVIRTLGEDSESETVTVDPADENYSVNWKSTEGSDIAVGSSYRAVLRVGSIVLGWVDLRAVAKQKDVKSVPTGFVGLVPGHPFHFKWRIETGIAGGVTVSPASATIEDDETQRFTATVTDLHGSALPGARVDWTVDDPAVATLEPTSGTTDDAGQTATTATPAGTLGSTTVRATAGAARGAAALTVVPSCTPASPDRDRDRLPDCYETNTGRFESATRTGSDPDRADTDRDGIKDGDEVLGTVLGLDLPAMGVSPLRRDILIEYDWFDDGLDACAPHTHRPRASALARVTAAFSSAPVTNPDGSTGINFIHDYGQGGVFTGGGLIADPNGVIDGGVLNIEFQGYKAANFAANRRGYFHYALLPHRYATTSGSSGQAEIFGDDLIVSLQCFGSDVNVANTIVHELGHNLNLRHGGFENQNYKPNYNSVMNYMYQFPGIDNDCTPPGNGVLSYSTGSRPALNENNLDERQGVCGNPPGPAWDWNGDGDATDVNLAFNINSQDGPVLSVLQDYNDWANLMLQAVAPPTPLAGVQATRIAADPEVVSCENVPPEAEQ